MSWFIRYETIDPAINWGEVQRAFISRFSDVRSEKKP